MKNPNLVAASLTVLALSCGVAMAQPHDDQRFDGGHAPPQVAAHPEWSKGRRIAHADWARGTPVDYHARHLRQPPRGYEWRDIDGRMILAAAATGLIADVVVNSR
jgi:Ni/Co efflux regulator RcnB